MCPWLKEGYAPPCGKAGRRGGPQSSDCCISCAAFRYLFLLVAPTHGWVRKMFYKADFGHVVLFKTSNKVTKCMAGSMFMLTVNFTMCKFISGAEL